MGSLGDHPKERLAYQRLSITLITSFWFLLLGAAFQANAAPPLTEIFANNSKNSLTITPAESLNLAIGLTANDGYEQAGDWFIQADTPFGWYHFNATTGGWQPGQAVSYQASLFNIVQYPIMNMPLPPGQYTFYFNVDLNQDGNNDNFANATSVEVTVQDTPLTPTLNIGDDISVLESDPGAGNILIPVTLNMNPESGQDVRVSWSTTVGSASGLKDYRMGFGYLTFTAGGALTQYISIQVYDDSEFEVDEYFNVTLKSPSNAELGNDSMRVFILNDEAGPMTLSTVQYISMLEGDTGTSIFSIPVSISTDPAPDADVLVNWNTNTQYVATPNVDYEAGEGTLRFTHGGPRTQFVDVTIYGDTDEEYNEAFLLKLSNPVNTELNSIQTTYATILNDDVADVSRHLSINSPSMDEGNSTSTLSFEVSVSDNPAPYKDIKVNWTTSNGSATAGSDYTPQSGTLTFRHDAPLTQTVDITILGDFLQEGDETFTVTLSNPVNADITTAVGTGTLINDDIPDGALPTLSINSIETYERDVLNNAISLMITLSKKPSLPVYVDWSTADGTATLGDNDYLPASGSLTFDSNSPLVQWVRVTAIADMIEEQDETVMVNLSNIYNSATSAATGTITLLNDDGAGSPTPDMLSPQPGSTLDSTTITFTWEDGGMQKYYLDIGSTQGSNDIYSTVTTGGITSVTVDGLPNDGSALYVRLTGYRLDMGRQVKDFIYQAYTTP